MTSESQYRQFSETNMPTRFVCCTPMSSHMLGMLVFLGYCPVLDRCFSKFDTLCFGVSVLMTKDSSNSAAAIT